METTGSLVPPQARVASAGQSVTWIKQGVELFKRAPGIWIAIAVIYFVIAMVANLLPFIGGIAFSLVAPVFTVGIVQGCRDLDAGTPLTVGHLFSAFQGPRVGPLILLGLISMVAAFVLGLIAGLGALGAVAGSATVDPQAMGMGGLLVVLLVLAVGVLFGAAVWFAAPLVAFHGMEPIAAMKLSFTSCLSNFAALLVWSLIALLMIIVGAIPLGLGLLVVIPILFASYYYMYREVFD